MNSNNIDWQAIYAARRERLRALLRESGLDAMLVANAANRFYLSGFELHDGQPGETSGMLVISASGRDWLATDARYAEAAKAVWPEEIFIYSGQTARDVAGLLHKAGAIIGLECRHVSLRFARELGAYHGLARSFASADGLAEKLRVIKEPCEIAALKASFRLNHAMFSWLEARLPELPGATEASLAWSVEKFFREGGAQELAFATIAASGKNAAKPHAAPGPDVLPENGCLLVDAGCRVQNYCSDQTRSWRLGSGPGPKFDKCLELAQKAQKAALAIMRPGVACADVYKASRKVFEDAGVADAFTHGLGHGVGLETHEEPALSPRSRATLQKGMVVTVEPGLYYPQWGGVRWEHTVVVRDDGVGIL